MPEISLVYDPCREYCLIKWLTFYMYVCLDPFLGTTVTISQKKKINPKRQEVKDLLNGFLVFLWAGSLVTSTKQSGLVFSGICTGLPLGS